MISKFVFQSCGYGRLWGVHFGRLAGFPTSLLLVSGFRAAGRQTLACESGDSPGPGLPVTHPYPCFLGNEAHFLVPGSHFVFVPAFCFSAAPASTHTTLSFTLLELSHSESQSLNLSLSLSLFLFFLPCPPPTTLPFPACPNKRIGKFQLAALNLGPLGKIQRAGELGKKITCLFPLLPCRNIASPSTVTIGN